jgi:putative transposase
VSASAAFIESFNNRVCCEFLNAQWFHTLAEGQLKAHTWLHGYNTTHSHSALGYRTPEEFLATYETYQPPQKSVAA